MKKVKMFLIAFFLLTCSSFAFATKLDEKERQNIRNTLAKSNSKSATNFVNTLENKGIIKNSEFYVLDAHNNLEIEKINEYYNLIDYFILYNPATFKNKIEKKENEITIKVNLVKDVNPGEYKNDKISLEVYDVLIKFKKEDNIYSIETEKIEKNEELTNKLIDKMFYKNLEDLNIENYLITNNFSFEGNKVKIVNAENFEQKEVSFENFKKEILEKVEDFKNKKEIFKYEVILTKNVKDRIKDAEFKDFGIFYDKYDEKNYKMTSSLWECFEEYSEIQQKIDLVKAIKDNTIDSANFKDLENFLKKESIIKDDLLLVGCPNNKIEDRNWIINFFNHCYPNDKPSILKYINEKKYFCYETHFNYTTLKDFENNIIIQQIKDNCELNKFKNNCYNTFEFFTTSKPLVLLKKINENSYIIYEFSCFYNIEENKINIINVKKWEIKSENKTIEDEEIFKELKIGFFKKQEEFYKQNRKNLECKECENLFNNLYKEKEEEIKKKKEEEERKIKKEEEIKKKKEEEEKRKKEEIEREKEEEEKKIKKEEKENAWLKAKKERKEKLKQEEKELKEKELKEKELEQKLEDKTKNEETKRKILKEKLLLLALEDLFDGFEFSKYTDYSYLKTLLKFNNKLNKSFKYANINFENILDTVEKVNGKAKNINGIYFTTPEEEKEKTSKEIKNIKYQNFKKDLLTKINFYENAITIIPNPRFDFLKYFLDEKLKNRMLLILNIKFEDITIAKKFEKYIGELFSTILSVIERQRKRIEKPLYEKEIEEEDLKKRFELKTTEHRYILLKKIIDKIKIAYKEKSIENLKNNLFDENKLENFREKVKEILEKKIKYYKKWAKILNYEIINTLTLEDHDTDTEKIVEKEENDLENKNKKSKKLEFSEEFEKTRDEKFNKSAEEGKEKENYLYEIMDIIEKEEEKRKKEEEEIKKKKEEEIKKKKEEEIKRKRERKIKTYNLNFFTQKDKNKLKNLKIAENEEDLELIKNEIVNKLEEEDLIKLKKITLAGKTPYVIPLKLEIEYTRENGNKTFKWFKWFKLEIYYSVSLKGFKAKNIKTMTKEEYDKII